MVVVSPMVTRKLLGQQDRGQFSVLRHLSYIFVGVLHESPAKAFPFGEGGRANARSDEGQPALVHSLIRPCGAPSPGRRLVGVDLWTTRNKIDARCVDFILLYNSQVRQRGVEDVAPYAALSL